MTQIIIGSFAQIITMRRLPLHGKLHDHQLEIIHNGGIVIDGEKIMDIGNFEKLCKQYPNAAINKIANNNMVAMPGLIDCHTHICFDGSRASDFALRIAGKSYRDIPNTEGGILYSAKMTRLATPDILTKNTARLANQHIAQGVTTTEVKSGYGLTIIDEIKILNAIHNAQQYTQNQLIATCLAAHTLPPEFDNPQVYLDFLVDELLPNIKQLTNRVDIFIDKKAGFDANIAHKYLQQAKTMGYAITVHADQFEPTGSQIAIDNAALSADHLEHTNDHQIHAFGGSATVAVALPGASIGLGEPFAPARKLLNANACLAIATDYNPGSAPMGNLLAQAAIIATFQKLTTAEVFAAITHRAAKALNIHKNIGILDTNYQADIIAFDTNDYREILYQQGNLTPTTIIKKGKIVA